jgi:hypothetical protein
MKVLLLSETRQSLIKSLMQLLLVPVVNNDSNQTLLLKFVLSLKEFS